MTSEIVTKAQFEQFIRSRNACLEGCNWVHRQPVQTAEDIWLAIDRLDWIVWLVGHGSGQYKFKDMEQLRWHIVQSSLDALGADYVHERDFNKPLSSRKRAREVLQRIDAVWYGYENNLTRYYALNQLRTQLRYFLCWPRNISILHDRGPWSSDLEQAYIQDIRHVLSWEDVAKAALLWVR